MLQQPENMERQRDAIAQRELEELIACLLDDLWSETQRGRLDIPMAAVCKRVGLRMSTLQRHLTALAQHGLVETACDDHGRWTVRLTSLGQGLYDPLAA